MVGPRRTASEDRIQIGPKRKIAFVCSGGASKAGAFHLGVALALQEQGFKFYGGLAPTTEAPVWSVMSPEIVARNSWANKPDETNINRQSVTLLVAFIAVLSKVLINSF